MNLADIDPDRLYSVNEVAAFCGVNRSTARSWLVAGKVPIVERRHSSRLVTRRVYGRYIPILNGVEVIPPGWEEKNRKKKPAIDPVANEKVRQRLRAKGFRI